jgi:cell wall-associated NlpC family hydrolase
MVLRRLPVLLIFCLLALAAPPAALAHHHHWDGGDDAASQYDDGSAGDDPAYVDPADDPAYVDPADDPAYVDPTAGDDPAAAAPSTTAPSTTAPSGTAGPDDPWGTLAPALPTVPVTRTVPGKVARLRTDGKAAIPRAAPKRVQALIAAANHIIGKPYLWGGGHAKIADAGYDCSGAVSYALIGAQLLAAPMVSGTLAKWDAAGSGKWLSIYANKGHVYLEVAGLRLDTSAVGDRGGRGGVRWRPVIGRRTGFHARHPVGL